MNKSQLLRNLARKAGLCDKWFSEWSDNESDDALLERYIKGIDFCILHDYPSLPIIRSTFDEDTLRRHNIYLDAKSVTVNSPQPVSVFLGTSKANIAASAYSVSDIYVRHNSAVHIHARDHAIVSVTVYDQAKVVATIEGQAKVHIYNRSDRTTIVAQTGITVRQ